MSKKLVDWVNINQLLRNAEPKKILLQGKKDRNLFKYKHN